MRTGVPPRLRLLTELDFVGLFNTGCPLPRYPCYDCRRHHLSAPGSQKLVRASSPGCSSCRRAVSVPSRVIIHHPGDASTNWCVSLSVFFLHLQMVYRDCHPFRCPFRKLINSRSTPDSSLAHHLRLPKWGFTLVTISSHWFPLDRKHTFVSPSLIPCVFFFLDLSWLDLSPRLPTFYSVVVEVPIYFGFRIP